MAEPTKNHDGNLVWVDLEMTGLDINTCHIIEMACVITDGDLNIVAEGEDLIIHQSDEIMDNMGEWCTKQHGESGLTQSVKDSHISLQECERRMIEFIKKHTVKGKNCLAGNSVHADKEFLKKYMPNFMEHLHYRIIDVSTVKELTRRWYPKEFGSAPRKTFSHRALQDIKESIEELRYYRKSVFK
ncbi:oligoribonuclease, mitochondrial-like [Clytia hemisphaerica]|uniref:oligoribonuclease, mitochondrial-like n=1 Tax=Clytia hemisphaerica TaxID=252671 RepID=UPI0034D78396